MTMERIIIGITLIVGGVLPTVTAFTIGRFLPRHHGATLRTVATWRFSQPDDPFGSIPSSSSTTFETALGIVPPDDVWYVCVAVVV